MRVLCLNPYLPPPVGGIEKEMLALGGELLDLGHEVTLLTSTARFPRGENPVAEGVPEGIRTLRLRGLVRTTLRDFAPARAPLVIPGLARAARELEPDLVLVFNAGWGPALRPALRALRGVAGRPPILYRTYYHPPGGRLANHKARYILGTVALADRAVLATGRERCELAGSGHIEPSKLRVVPPGVHLHPPDPGLDERVGRELGTAGRTLIAHVGRLGRFKGTGHLIEVLPEVRRRTGLDVGLLLVGANQEPAYLAERLERFGVRDHVVFAGEVHDDRRLRALLRQARVFALPSVYEAFGIAYIEALAEGVACVGAAVGGVAEAIGDGGLLIPAPGDTGALADALVRLLGEAGLAERLGEAGRRRVQGSLTWRHTAEGLLALGEECRGEGGRG